MIDSRILEMVFKNKQFEDGVSESIKSIEKLDRSLDKVDGSGTSAAMDKIGGVCEKVSEKFSLLETIATGAMLRIGSRAADMAVDLAKSLSIDQVTAGWSKYNDKTTAMQTIMNNAHKENGDAYSIEEVNAEMEKLNWFTDETSYNFTDMVSNIGKFTSMGKGLEDSVTAMQGISVWASASGQGVAEASRAMYNLSQAMGVGALKLQDWKSIQNANMATEQFKEQAMESAAALGSLEKKLDETTGKYKYFIKGTQQEVSTAAFDQTLSEGWLDSNVLMDTLKEYGKFADELNKLVNMTGMEATQIVNDNSGLLKDYAKAADKMAFLTKYVEKENIVFEDESYTIEDLAAALDKLNSEEFALSKKAFKAAQEAKTLTEAIDATKDAVSTGWMNIFEQIFGNYEEAKAVWSQLAEDLYSIFTPATDSILETLMAWRELDDFEGAMGTRQDLFDSLHMLLTVLFDIDTEVTSLGGIMHEVWQEIFPSSAESNALKLATVIDKLHKGILTFKRVVEDNAENIANVFRGLFSVLKVLKTVASGVFRVIGSIITAVTRGFGGNILQTLGDFGAKVAEISDDILPKIDAFFDGIVDKIDYFRRMLRSFARGGVDLSWADVGKTWKTDKIQAIAKAFGILREGINKVVDTLKSVGTIWKSFSAYENVFGKALGFSDVSKQSTGIRKVLMTIYVILQKLKGAFEKVRDTFKNLRDIIKNSGTEMSVSLEKPKKVTEALGTAIGKVGTAFGKFVDRLSSAKTDEGTLGKLFKFFGNLWKIIKAVGGVVKGLFDALLDGFNGLMDDVSVETIMDLIKSGVIITIITKISKAFKSFFGIVDGGGSLFGAIGDTLEALQGSIENFNKGQNVKLLKTIAVSVLILVAALLLLSTIDAAGLTQGIITIGLLMAELSGFLILTSKFMGNSKGMKKAGKMLTSMAMSLLLMAVAAKIMASVDPVAMDRALVNMSIMLAEMTGVAIVLSKFGGKAKTQATALLGMAAAMILLTVAVKLLGMIKPDELKQGIAAIGFIFGEIALFMIALKQGGNMISTAFSMILLATAMNIMAGAVKNLGSMGTEELIQGLIGLGVALGEMVVALLLLSDEKVLGGAAAMLILSVAMLALTPALLAFAALSWENLLKGLLGIGIALGEMVVALQMLDDPKVLAGAAAILIIAAALLILTPAILAFSMLSWEGLAKSLVLLAGVMAIFVAAMWLLSPLGPVILAVAGAFALFGVAVLAVGAGVLLLATGISILTVAGSAAVTMVTALLTAVIEAIPLLITAVAAGLVALITGIAESIDAIVQAVAIILTGILEAIMLVVPSILELVGMIISGVLGILVENTPTFMEWLGQLFTGLFDILLENTPRFMEWLGQLITGFLDLLIESTPKFFEWLGEVLQGLIDLIAEYIPKFIKAVLDCLVALVQEIAAHTEDFVAAALGIIEGFIRGIADGIPGIIDAAFKLVIAFIDGLAEAIENNTEPLFEAIDRLLWAVINAIVSFFTHAWKNIKKAGSDLMQSGFIRGMKDKIDKVKEVVTDIASKIGGWFKNKWESMKEIGGNLIDGLKSGMKETGEKIKDTVTEVAGKVTGWFKSIFGIASPSKVFAEMGEYNMLGLAKGIEDYADVVEDSAEDVGEGTMDALGKAMSDVSDMLENNPDMSPTITPVLDLSQIQNGARNIGSYFGNANVGLTASSFNNARAAQAAQQSQSNSSMAQALKYYTDKMVSALEKQRTDTSVNVTLEGDAAGIFRAVRTQNDRYKVSTGRSALI